MKSNYKPTDIGFVPPEWHVRPLGEIGPVKMCKRVFKEQTRNTGDVPFYKIGTFGDVPDAFITKDLYNEFKKKYSFPQKGDVLISAAGTIGRTVVYDGAPAYFQDSNIVWIDNDQSKATNDYLYHYYQVTKWSVSHGGTVARLYNDNLRTKIYVAIPPLPEQHAIVEVLNDTNSLLSKLSLFIVKKRQLKQALMYELLTGKTRLQGFKKEWKTRELGQEIIRLKKTKRQSSTGKDIGLYPFFTNTTKPVDRFIDEHDFNTEAIIANTGGVAYFNYFKGKFAAMSDCFVFESRINALFLYYYLKLVENEVHKNGFTGSGIKHLDKKYFNQIKFLCPVELGEQTAIAGVLTDMDAEINALEARRDKTLALKQGMMHELLTGKTRLL